MSEEIRLTRPLVVMALSYIAGIVLGRLWLEEPFWAWWAAGLLLLSAIIMSFRKTLPVFMAVLLLIACASGAAAFVFVAAPASGGVLEYAGSPVYIEGTVVEEPVFHEDHDAYRLRVETVETKEGRNPVTGDLLVKIYGREREAYWFGERLRLRGTIVEPRGRRNPGGFDYRFYLRSQGIDGLVYPRPLQVSSLGPGEVGRAAGAAFTLRVRMVEGIEANLPSPAAELLIAILFGQRHRLPAEIEENYRRAGAGQILPIAPLSMYQGNMISLTALFSNILKIPSPFYILFNEMLRSLSALFPSSPTAR